MTTPSIDTPEAINNLFDFALEDIPVAAPAAAPKAPAAGLNPGATPAFAEGGMVGRDGGVPAIDTGVAPASGAGLAVPGEEAPVPAPGAGGDMEGEAKALLRSQPAMAAQMLQAAEDALELGEMTEEILIQGGKMAIVASRNPDMYPKMVQRLTAMGAKDLPPEYDPEFIFTAIMLYLAWMQKDEIKASGQAGGDIGGTGDDGVQDFRNGGYVTHGSNAKDGGKVVGMGGPRDDMVRADLSNGEYVIPAHVVRDKGVDFFDKMLATYEPGKKA